MLIKSGAVILMSVLLSSAASSAFAASLESLVMPGPVVSAHAEYEEECSNCHDLFEQSSQQTLCLDCHEETAADLTAGTGFHGRDASASTAPCSQCHTEHEGRTADIVGLQADLFDHEITDFPLTGSHARESCSACHQPDTRHADAPGECIGCHESDDVHQQALGTTCADCHDAERWLTDRFDHSTTEFLLEGQHGEAACLGCHMDQTFEALDTGCASCHRLDDIHDGGNGDACGDCHGFETWDVRFDHGEETGFHLAGSHGQLSCRNCHVTESDFSGLPTDCQGCHNGDDVHLGRNGPGCGDCHDQTSWETSFDHLSETGFELQGAHDNLTCSACHSAGLEVPVASECIGCHEADDPHAATLVDCAGCHGQTSWEEEQRFHHDLAGFALVGLHRSTSCEQCHDSLVFSPVAHECNDCHAAEDQHDGAMGSSCESCHNPAGWGYWLFEHGDHTDFPLTGGHESLNCAACHPADSSAARQSQACVSCHRTDDVHDGGFGQNCNRCHLTDNFEELKRDI